MKIIAVHRGFACDHSSTSYEFLAVDKPLDEKARRAVSSLSRRANPTRRRVSFIYHAEGRSSMNSGRCWQRSEERSAFVRRKGTIA